MNLDPCWYGDRQAKADPEALARRSLSKMRYQRLKTLMYLESGIPHLSQKGYT
ncbi:MULTISPECIES: hypothetical protein [unclassified Microcoleus]|uniref:hypothetical protein n=1 Tax=unclassified Microcoleus TaxID=2642155 RepID=UPI001D745A22|nr:MULTISPECIES: hypothetical protein [unclassified Microcoleus]MCC3506881.1 hypothetical protein [Microcoleus sp. PH2017_19_SFW_U_A]MCC3448294.1 hypothetical protein [Microcoleus sp. PH2017_09_SFU_O_A]MCC3525529.1 hypothetical protein [Microcoleus sp. PH2017_20_SFW_D_A]MCC3556387.1 hypothetical protein [Microcoleus sp. PH2017_35_SFW_U_B]MCC3629177.1 hypothetical protein [Microcoleus sp. PH2017_39_LGB_O_B]